jgi:hypothetical protein
VKKLPPWIPWALVAAVVVWGLAHKSCGGCQRRWAAMKAQWGL